MKYLVDESTGNVRGGFEQPLQFSVSGHYVIDVPDVLGVTPPATASALIAAKVAATKALHPNLPNALYSEFLSGPSVDVDAAQSTFFTTGPNKRTSAMATSSVHGQVRTPTMSIATSITKVYFQCSYYLLSERPSPSGASDILYNYDSGSSSFVDSPAGMTATLTDASNTTLLALTPGLEQAFVSGSVNVRISFRNANNSGRIWVSDFILLYG